MAEEENVMRKELGLIGGISLAAGSTIGIVYEINLSFLGIQVIAIRLW